MKQAKKIEIEQIANNVIQDYELDIPTNLEHLSAQTEIELVSYPDHDSGISGALVKQDCDFIILYATKVSVIGYQRFSIAHEFGHYFLPEHPESVFDINGWHKSRAGQESKDEYEQEADYFAVCLLMPKQVFIKKINQNSDGLEGILKLSETFQTSITATALRYTELSDIAVGVIVSENGVVKFSRFSKEMMRLGSFDKSKKGQPITKSVVSSTNDELKEVLSETTNLDNWIDCEPSLQCKEDVLDLGSYGKRITLITLIECDDEDDEWEDPSF